jgi:hypothetical protein
VLHDTYLYHDDVVATFDDDYVLCNICDAFQCILLLFMLCVLCWARKCSGKPNGMVCTAPWTCQMAGAVPTAMKVVPSSRAERAAARLGRRIWADGLAVGTAAGRWTRGSLWSSNGSFWADGLAVGTAAGAWTRGGRWSSDGSVWADGLAVGTVPF